jgi:hypothetical protein
MGQYEREDSGVRWRRYGWDEEADISINGSLGEIWKGGNGKKWRDVTNGGNMEWRDGKRERERESREVPRRCLSPLYNWSDIYYEFYPCGDGHLFVV